MSNRVAELKLAREVVAPHLPALHTTLQSRRAKVLAGCVGIVGALAMFLTSILFEDGTATWIMLWSWVAGFAAYVLSRIFTPFFSRAAKVPSLQLTGNLEADLARLQPTMHLEELDQKLARIERWSTGLPLAAISLLMPLTLHWMFWAVATHEDMRSFSSWIRISLVVVGHAHLTLAVLALAFAKRTAHQPLEVLQTQSIHKEWGKTWGFTILVASVPGILLLLVPPILSAVTGLAFIPAMYVLTWKKLLQERTAIEMARVAVGVRVAEQPPLLDHNELESALAELCDPVGSDIERDHVARAQLGVVPRSF